MLNEKTTQKGTKNKITPRIKIKIKTNQIKNFPNIYKATDPNLNYNTNLTPRKMEEIYTSNKSGNISGLNYGEICKINSLTNEDKDLETLISELKTTFIQKSKISSKENNNEDDIFIKNNNNNNNFYLFKNDDYNFQKRKDSNIIDFTNLHLDLDEPGYEINQRVHSKKAKTHYKIKSTGNKINNIKKINKNILNYNNLNRINSPEKNNKNHIISENLKRNKYNLKNSKMKTFTSLTNKKKGILYKFKTSRNKINSISILDKNIFTPKKNKKKLTKKISRINCNRKITKLINSTPKNYKNSFINNIKNENKCIICSPISVKLNESNNNDANSKRNKTETKKINYNNSNKDIGELYIKKKYKRIKTEQNKLKLFKKNNSNLNPFENKSSVLKRTPNIKKIHSYVESFFEKSDNNKKSLDNHRSYRKPKLFNQMCLKSRKIINIPNRNHSHLKKIESINIIF